MIVSFLLSAGCMPIIMCIQLVDGDYLMDGIISRQ
uniref:Uncharacterized protein n=1 Tax=Rhizophora mucronata TaxID=61149 RepID=A0A2P2NDK2_RHIMU